ILIPAITVFIMGASTIGSFIAITMNPSFITKRTGLHTLLHVSPFWLIARLLGTIFAGMTLFKLGPEMIHSENTGGLLIYHLIPI
ncbi:YjiH family protein, partial [Staphylococcus sp. SIMBA_130]